MSAWFWSLLCIVSTLQLKGKNRKEQKPAWVLFSFCPNPCFDFLFLDVNVNAVFIFMIVIACQVNLNKNYFGRKSYFVKCYTFKHLSSSMCTVKSKSRLLPINFFCCDWSWVFRNIVYKVGRAASGMKSNYQ